MFWSDFNPCTYFVFLFFIWMALLELYSTVFLFFIWFCGKLIVCLIIESHLTDFVWEKWFHLLNDKSSFLSWAVILPHVRFALMLLSRQFWTGHLDLWHIKSQEELFIILNQIVGFTCKLKLYSHVSCRIYMGLHDFISCLWLEKYETGHFHLHIMLREWDASFCCPNHRNY